MKNSNHSLLFYFILYLFLQLFSIKALASEQSQQTPVLSSYALSEDQKKALVEQHDSGDIEAAFKLWLYFEFVAGDRIQAYKWLKKSAIGGNSIAQFNLGLRMGGEKNFGSCIEAFYWFSLAEKNGVDRARKELDRLPDCRKY